MKIRLYLLITLISSSLIISVSGSLSVQKLFSEAGHLYRDNSYVLPLTGGSTLISLQDTTKETMSLAIWNGVTFIASEFVECQVTIVSTSNIYTHVFSAVRCINGPQAVTNKGSVLDCSYRATGLSGTSLTTPCMKFDII